MFRKICFVLSVNVVWHLWNKNYQSRFLIRFWNEILTFNLHLFIVIWTSPLVLDLSNIRVRRDKNWNKNKFMPQQWLSKLVKNPSFRNAFGMKSTQCLSLYKHWVYFTPYTTQNKIFPKLAKSFLIYSSFQDL
jgi:hypothetical protein